VIDEIRSILEPDTAGDPMSDRKWTHATAENVAECLGRIGIRVSASVVLRLLGEIGYSLKSNKKCLSAGNDPNRDTQFGIIKCQRAEFMDAGDPVISVDTKKKELIGLFKNPGRTWRIIAKLVRDHDFRSEALGIASPYGIYDTVRNFGLVVVGQSADTPQFAVNSIVQWWLMHGQYDYPTSKRLLVLADSGGSNGARPRAWKWFLQKKFADTFGIAITVAHYPTGASKWNPVEHRLFSEISKNWAGVPLETFDTLAKLVSDTRTKTGLRVQAIRDRQVYKRGIKISDTEMKQLALRPREALGKWNYTILPRLNGTCVVPN
jgi:hypothetical protein